MIASKKEAIMPWKKHETPMELKTEFAKMADKPNVNMSQLCRHYNISRKTGYKWLHRYQDEGIEGLAERSRRPHSSPGKTPEPVEQLVLQARDNDPGWGGRKLAHHMRTRAGEGELAITPEQVPAPSTITDILARHDRLSETDSCERQGPWKRFEYPVCNALWQMDFKGEFRLGSGPWCYPLTIIDDHSRFALATKPCANQRYRTVKGCLDTIFSRYGLPEAILCDNGSPWGSSVRFPNGQPHYTKLAAWLIRLGIQVKYSRPNHPQSKGKNERFNGTLKAELLRFERFADQARAARRLAEWRNRYNTARPHEALDMDTPASHYQPSQVTYPDQLPAVEYGPDDATRKVSAKGKISFKGQSFRIGKAFEGHQVAVRASSHGKQHEVYFCNQHIRTINLDR
jgi:transposase InsO family protein